MPESSSPGRSDSERLHTKYLVHKAADGEPVDGCFVIRPDRDPAARVALLAYAQATDNEALKADLRAWVQGIYDAQDVDRVRAVRVQVAEEFIADATRRAEEAERAMEEARFSLGYAQEAYDALVASSRSQMAVAPQQTHQPKEDAR